MTIYKTHPSEKKPDQTIIDGEVVTVTEPLTGLAEVDDLESVTPKVVRVTYNPRRTRTMVNLCLIITALLVLGIGLIGAVYLYKHLAGRIVQGRCGVTFYDEMYGHESSDLLHDGAAKPMADNLRFFEEEIFVSEVDQYETLKVPEFDECLETVVWHDFGVNYTAIIDNHLEVCYVMNLNRSMVVPPKDLIDLIHKFKKGYYLPSAEVIRAKYRQVLPPISDMTKFGPFILRQCRHYDTYRLIKLVDGVYKRSVHDEKTDDGKNPMKIHHYGFSTFKNTVLKITVIPQ